jgi:hypothetical protein
MATPIISSSLFTDANLKYYWQFDGNSTAATGSQNGTDSNITYEPSSKTGFGSASLFNSNADRISFGTVFPPRGISGTIAAWVKPLINGASGSQQWNFSSWYCKGDVYGRIGHIPGNKVRAYFYNSSDQVVYYDSNTTLTIGSWNHVVYTWNASSSSIYINGIYDTGSAYTMYNMHSAGDAGTIYAGLSAEVGSLNYVFSGSLDELAFFNRELNATEIYDLYADAAPIKIYQKLQMIL